MFHERINNSEGLQHRSPLHPLNSPPGRRFAARHGAFHNRSALPSVGESSAEEGDQWFHC